ncbi:MAG: HAMP domain-containing sensor histidine kinase [Pirellulaceae bacterium]
MRWPLRRQILLPMLAVMLATAAGVSGVNAWLSSRRTLGEIEDQLHDVVETLSAANFPLTRGVLRQTRGLTGADYAVTDRAGNLIAASDDAVSSAVLETHIVSAPGLALTRTLDIADARYFYAVWNLDRRASDGQSLLLHVYYPERRWRQAQQEAVLPPLALGAAALVVVGLLSLAIASRVTRPIDRLRLQVERIAEGDFQPLPPTQRNDEIRDLCLAVNRMAALLAHYEEQVRRTERLRTLGQLGGGLAHQMRNAATGCRIALDLHRRSCQTGQTDENLSVAERQLTLMEQHLRRYLALGRSEDRAHGPVELERLVEEVLPLVRPTAAHVGVDLQYEPPTESLSVSGDPQSLQQVVVNLLLNGVEAVSNGARADHASPTTESTTDAAAAQSLRRVTISVRRVGESASVRVVDSGPGPEAHIAEQMFEPLISDKADGAGLGLAVAREIVEHHGGLLVWKRTSDATSFEFKLPILSVEAAHGTFVDR